MSEPDAKITRGQDVPWRRWQMTELDARRRKATGNTGAASQQTGRAAESTAQLDQTAQDRGSAVGARPAKTSTKRPAGPQGGRRQSAQRDKQARPADSQNKALDAERKKALEAAREQGHAEGLKAGQAEGYAEGLEEGRKAAREELQKQIEETLQPVQHLALQFSDALALLNDEMAKDLVELALSTGRQLAGEALEANPAQVVDLVRGLLHSEPAMHGKPRLWLHPKDHDLVNEYLGQELEAAGWALQPDDQVSRGGCRVTSATGELDATWESRWQAVRQQIRSRRSASEQAAAAQALLDAATATGGPEVAERPAVTKPAVGADESAAPSGGQ
jgi:flagellar assembly protein FliH